MKRQNSRRRAASKATPQDVITDPRFTSFTTDPRFRLPSKKHTRTKIDKRFSRMLKDDDFVNTAKVDRYGRNINNSAKKQALQRLYEPEEADEDESGVDDAADVEVEDDDIVERELTRANAAYDPARGGGFSSSDDDEEDEEDGGVEVEEVVEFPDVTDKVGVPVGEITSRIAVVNLDWDNIRAVDLMAVFSSFVSSGGRIEKVSVYKSDFGRDRMEREDVEGPPKDVFTKKPVVEEEGVENDLEDDSEDEEDGEKEDEDDADDLDEKIKKDLLQEDNGEDFNSTSLRQYQLERLRYFYAVMICSDRETANHIYESTDGTEYLSSANFFDLRFIPDDVDFNDKPRDECTSVPNGYRPTEFVTDALQHSKVKLTWDADDTERKAIIRRAFSGNRAEIGENDLRAYLGSDSSEDEEQEANLVESPAAPKLTKKELARQKLRADLGLPDEPSFLISKATKLGPVGGMEITFTAGLSSKTKDGVFENEPNKVETTAEAYVRKERERKARRKEKAKALRVGQDPTLNKEPDDSATKVPPTTVDDGFEDPFFTIDEAAKGKASKSLQKQARREKREAKAVEAAAQASNRAELELLMADTTDTTTKTGLDHFDINEILRAEKEAKKKKRQRSRKGKENADEDGKRGGLQKDFKMDVADPRFSAVFEKHEFAIDPSNPKFKRTEGMNKLLEEGRKRRKMATTDVDGMGEEFESTKQGKKRKARRDDDKVSREMDSGSTSLKGLVEGLKKKARRSS